MKIYVRFLVALFALVTISLRGQAANDAGPAPKRPITYVIVHGATGGGWDWKTVAGLLQASGHTVYRPTLTGLGERMHLASAEVGLTTHINDIVNVILF